MTSKTVVHNIAQNVTEHHELFYQSAEFWIAIAFVLVACGLFKPVKTAVAGLISKRIDRIKNELQEAEELKLKAQELYAEYERKFLNADNEVTEIVSEQESVIAETKERKKRELNDLLRQKQREVDGRIELAFAEANAEINTLISMRTAEILRSVISVKLTKNDYNNLIEKSIENIKQHF